jgi:hypothetical protein
MEGGRERGRQGEGGADDSPARQQGTMDSAHLYTMIWRLARKEMPPNRPHVRSRETRTHTPAAAGAAVLRARKEEVREQNNLDAAVHGARMIAPANASCQWKGTGLRRFKRRGVRAKFSFARTESIVLRESHLR